jgi:erythromycin esterase
LAFDAFAENRELIEWMRQYNADPAHHRKLHFYGIDLSLGGPSGSIPTPAALFQAVSYLKRVDAATGAVRPALRSLLEAISGSTVDGGAKRCVHGGD